MHNTAIISIGLASILMLGGCEALSQQIEKPSIKDVKQIPMVDKKTNNKLAIINISTIMNYNPNYYNSKIPLSQDLQEYIYNLCQDKHIDYNLVLAIIWHESDFQVDKISKNSNHTLDYGLCQINSCHKSEFKSQGITNILDPYQNVKFAINMLSNLNTKYSEKDSLIAYGIGEMGMKRLKRKGYDITKAAQEVLNKRNEYKQITNL